MSAKKYSITFGKLAGSRRLLITDVQLRREIFFNDICVDIIHIFLASAEYINLEMNLKVTEVTSSQFGDTLLYAGPGFPLF